MKPFQVLDLPVDRIETEIVVVPFFADQRPLQGPAALLDWRLNGLLTRQLVDGKARGHFGDRFLIKGNHKVRAEWVMFVGCGDSPDAIPSEAQKVVSEMLQAATQAKFRLVGLGLPVVDAASVALWQEVLQDTLSTLGARRLDCLLSACDPAEYVN